MHDDPLSRLSFNPCAYGHKRASNRDRQVTFEILKSAHLECRLRADEFHQRSDSAAKLVTMGEIPPLISDIVDDPAERGHVTTDRESADDALIRLSTTSMPLTPQQIKREATAMFWRKVRFFMVIYLSFAVLCIGGLLGLRFIGVDVSDQAFSMGVVFTVAAVVLPLTTILNRQKETEAFTEELKRQARVRLRAELDNVNQAEPSDG